MAFLGSKFPVVVSNSAYASALCALCEAIDRSQSPSAPPPAINHSSSRMHNSALLYWFDQRKESQKSSNPHRCTTSIVVKVKLPKDSFQAGPKTGHVTTSPTPCSTGTAGSRRARLAKIIVPINPKRSDRTANVNDRIIVAPQQQQQRSVRCCCC